MAILVAKRAKINNKDFPIAPEATVANHTSSSDPSLKKFISQKMQQPPEHLTTCFLCRQSPGPASTQPYQRSLPKGPC